MTSSGLAFILPLVSDFHHVYLPEINCRTQVSVSIHSEELCTKYYKTLLSVNMSAPHFKFLMNYAICRKVTLDLLAY